ncbi:CsbD family protein [Pseudomonas sp. RL_15y_Pfl2_60]|uniref:CsbD family protein n=1 Tax=Pseudomonas sp. RL_15y_Pfl2_60 TaxID=3088709 RepID=UPI0030D725F9
MNSDVIKGKWKQLNGRIKERWGNLTDDDMDVAEGHSEYLAGKLQERYGWSKEKAQQELRDFSEKL